MGNLKEMFYKRYYEGVNYDLTDAAKKENAKLFREKNIDINDYTLDIENVGFRVLDLPSLGLDLPSFKLATTNPGLIIGTGYMHEMHTEEEYKLGFFFDHTTGLPILPGSSIKGVIRSAFPNFAATKAHSLIPDFEATDKKGQLIITEKQKQKAFFIQELLPALKKLDDESLFTKVHQLEWAIFEGLDIAATQKEHKIHRTKMSQRCVFYDAHIIAPAPNNKIVGGDVLAPHKAPLKNPIPLPFLKVLPDVTFQFLFSLRDISVGGDWMLAQKELLTLFKDILLFFGMGAKTNVGYGQFTDQMPDTVKQAAHQRRTQHKPQAKVPTNIPKGMELKATLTKIIADVCVFQFKYGGQDFQFVKSITNITKKWAKKGYDQAPSENKTYSITMQADIVAGQKNPNFTVIKPKPKAHE